MTAQPVDEATGNDTFPRPRRSKPAPKPAGLTTVGFLVCAALTAAAGLLLALYGPTSLPEHGSLDPNRSMVSGWSMAGFYAIALAMVAGLGFHAWSVLARRRPIALAEGLALPLVAAVVVAAGMLFLDGTLQRQLIGVPLEKADRYYAWALESDYGHYREVAYQGRVDLAFGWGGDTDQAAGYKRIAASREAVAKYRALDARRIREARALVSRGVGLGPARTKALAAFDRRYGEIGKLSTERWDDQERMYEANQDMAELFKARFTFGQIPQSVIDRWRWDVTVINAARRAEAPQICKISVKVIGRCVITDSHPARLPD